MNKRGFIIAVPAKYQRICYHNVLTIRYKYGIQLPIELWQIGNEITDEYIQLFINIPNLYFKYVNEYTDNPEHWQGFQIKAFILKHTNIQEPILCDADIIFYTDPLTIYSDENYIRTGTYFFRDLDRWKFYNLHNTSDKFQSIDFYNARKQFILSLLPQKPQFFPKEWDYLYEASPPRHPVNEAYQESGVVYIDKTRHHDAVNEIYNMNYNHDYTYRYVWGDKETFWLGFLKVNKEYYINDTYGEMKDNKLTHYYKGCVFFTQK